MRRAIFECCKWHVQVEDRPILCSFPLVLEERTWAHLAGLAERLAKETLAAESELLSRTDLHDRLGLPTALRRCLRLIPTSSPTPGCVRVMRFDFHWTTDGWRISEANTDVAGGFIEASGVTQLVAEHYAACRHTGDPAGVLSQRIASAVGSDAVIGLMHLPIFSEDRQVMLYLAKRLEDVGLKTCLFSEDQLRWDKGRARAECEWHTGPLDFVIRFFPAEWLDRLPARTEWERLLVSGQTNVCNPAFAVLTQSKRFPLTWDKLLTPLATWRQLLPETRALRDVTGRLEDGWVIKPALGHEGRDVGICGVNEAAEWGRIRAMVDRDGANWVAQRRFDLLPLSTPEGTMYPCLGIYVIAGQVAGAYCRMAARPLIDDRSREVAVLIRKSTP